MWLYVFKIVLNGFTTLEMRWYDMTIDEPYLVHIFFSHGIPSGYMGYCYHILPSPIFDHFILGWSWMTYWRSLDIVGFPILPRCRCSSAHRRWEPKPSALTSHRSWKWRSQNVMGNLPSKQFFYSNPNVGSLTRIQEIVTKSWGSIRGPIMTLIIFGISLVFS